MIVTSYSPRCSHGLVNESVGLVVIHEQQFLRVKQQLFAIQAQRCDAKVDDRIAVEAIVLIKSDFLPRLDTFDKVGALRSGVGIFLQLFPNIWNGTLKPWTLSQGKMMIALQELWLQRVGALQREGGVASRDVQGLLVLGNVVEVARLHFILRREPPFAVLRLILGKGIAIAGDIAIAPGDRKGGGGEVERHRLGRTEQPYSFTLPAAYGAGSSRRLFFFRSA